MQKCNHTEPSIRFDRLYILLILCISLCNLSFAQHGRVAPGVNPNKYQPPVDQHQPPVAQQEDVKFHDPSEFGQQNDIPNQNNVQQPHINQPVPNNLNQNEEKPNTEKAHAPHSHQAHGHGIGESLDADHMKEHEKDDFVDFSKMTQGQIIMHHFRQFDQNKDGRVDGLEIFKKIQRENEEHQSKQPLTHAKSKEEIQYDTDQLAETVDHAMTAYDENDDGYIYYGEFYRAHTKNANKDIKDGTEE